VLFKARPVPGADTAVVILDRRGRLHKLDHPLTSGQVAWDTPKAVYQIDTAVHTLSFELQLPAAEEAFFFTANVVAQWRIIDPRAAVESSLSDPDPVLRSGVAQQLRGVSRSFTIEDSAQAEDAIRRSFASMPISLTQGIGLVMCTVSVSLDGSTSKHVASRIHAKRERESIKSKHETTQLNTELAIQQASAKQVLEEQQAMFAQKMAAQEEKHKLELERMNMQFYAQALSEDNLNLIALRLSSNRDDVNDVINLFMRQRELDYEGARGMLNSLLENRLVNKRDVADIMARATSVVADHMTRAPFDLGGSSARPVLGQATVPPPIESGPMPYEDDDDDLDDD
jgi:regulator of protease activity HflC (stomatin/prohibitin superfamily)